MSAVARFITAAGSALAAFPLSACVIVVNPEPGHHADHRHMMAEHHDCMKMPMGDGREPQAGEKQSGMGHCPMKTDHPAEADAPAHEHPAP